jgi:hypothetical protein
MKTTMKTIAVAAFAALFALPAFADEKPTDDEAAKIKHAVAAWGCSGGTFEKEAEGSGVLEAEDVKCAGGQYDFRLDKDYKVFAITKD